MKRKALLSQAALSGLLRKIHKSVFIGVFMLTLTFKGYAHHVETFTYNCVSPGQNLQIDAIVVFAGPDTWYQWQYRDNSGVWQCFVNGVNAINGVNFTVSGATSQNVEDDAPLLTINSVTAALENVQVRVLMRPGASPCNAPAGTTYGGDDMGIFETKYLRLHVYGNAAVCPPNAYLCDDNMLFNAQGYYGGFENKFFNTGTNTYTNNNFGEGIASSDFIFGTGAGRYQDINNPFPVSIDFPRNFPPHTGNFQMIVQGSANINDRAWYKTVAVAAGTKYVFSVFAARLDDSDPIITLKVSGVTIQTSDLSVQPVGSWIRISGQYNSASNGDVVISIGDSRAGGLNNYSLDDICFRQCLNCGTLPLHNLSLTAFLQGSNVGLKWTAENEMNTSQFIIERSTDGINFTAVGSKAASGQTNTITEYQSSDNIQAVLSASILYYRLRATDIDGRYSYSNISIVRLSKKAGVQVWPSPFRDNISITYNASANSRIDVAIVNSVGKVIKQGNYNVSQGLNQLSINNLDGLVPGIYFIRITDKNSSETYIQKLTK